MICDLTCIHQGGTHVKHERGKLAILISPMAIKTAYQDLPFQLCQIASDVGLILKRRISVPVSSQQVGPNVVEKCKRDKVMIALLRDLMVWSRT